MSKINEMINNDEVFGIGIDENGFLKYEDKNGSWVFATWTDVN